MTGVQTCALPICVSAGASAGIVSAGAAGVVSAGAAAGVVSAGAAAGSDEFPHPASTVAVIATHINAPTNFFFIMNFPPFK